MGTKERKVREKENLKDLILKGAREVFLLKGYEDTSIRNIADQIEYSPGTIYLYYKDKDSIFHALHQEGFQLLKQQMAVLMMVSDPFERLTAMGRTYLQFAEQYPDYYDLMFVVKAPLEILDDKDCWDEGQSAFDLLVMNVKECMSHGYFKGSHPEEMSYVIWATMHGIVTLSHRGRCRVISEEKRDNIQKLGFEAFVQMLSSLK
jgi:AcrR family transcriptional regulator